MVDQFLLSSRPRSLGNQFLHATVNVARLTDGTAKRLRKSGEVL
jgi:hypothetical protein